MKKLNMALHLTSESEKKLLEYINEIQCTFCEEDINLEKPFMGNNFGIKSNHTNQCDKCGYYDYCRMWIGFGPYYHTACETARTVKCKCGNLIYYGCITNCPACGYGCHQCTCKMRCGSCYEYFCNKEIISIIGKDMCPGCVAISWCCNKLLPKKRMNECAGCKQFFCNTCECNKNHMNEYDSMNGIPLKNRIMYCDECDKQNYKSCLGCNITLHINLLTKCSECQDQFCINCFETPYTIVNGAYKKTDKHYCSKCSNNLSSVTVLLV